MKQYITWTRLWRTPFEGIDLDHSIEKLWQNDSINIEIANTGYGNTSSDARIIARLTYPEDLDDSVKERFLKNYAYHCMTEISDTKALELLNGWYPSPDGVDNYFTLNSDGDIIDGRLVEED